MFDPKDPNLIERKAVTRFRCPPAYFDVDGHQWQVKECCMEYNAFGHTMGFSTDYVTLKSDKNLIVTPEKGAKTPQVGFYCGITMTMEYNETHYFLAVYLGDGGINKHVFKIVEETKYLDDIEKEPYPGFTDVGNTYFDRIALSTYTDAQLEIELTRRNSKVKAERYFTYTKSDEAEEKLKQIRDLLEGY